MPVPLFARHLGRRPCLTALCAGVRVRPRRGPAVRRRDRHADELLDIAQERCLLGIAERDGDAVRPGPRRAADAVHIGFRHVRKIVVHHMADAVDVDAACGDIGGDQRAHPALAKGSKHPFALVLRFVAVDRFGCDPGLDQAAHDLVGAVLGAREYESAVDRFALQYVHENRWLRRAVDMNDALLDAFDRGGGRRHRNLGRIA